MAIRVIYSTEAFLLKSSTSPGRQYERFFASLEEAKAEELPAGCVSAFIPVEGGSHVYSEKLGWEFHKNE